MTDVVVSFPVSVIEPVATSRLYRRQPVRPRRGGAVRYTLLLHYAEIAADQLGAESLQEGQRSFASYARALEQAEVLLSAEVLRPSASSTTVTVTDGSVRVQDGPFADTKEQLAGVFVIDVPDLDAAVAWAARAPAARWGAVEVRPGAVHFSAGSWQPST